MFDALVFDLDGTLWDASKSSAIGWNNGLRSLDINKTITVDDIKRVTGKPVMECLKILFPNELKQYQNFSDVLCRFEEVSVKKSGGIFYDKLHETIKYLSQKHDLFLVSNCQEWYLDVFFNFSGLKKYFKDSNCHGRTNKNKNKMLMKIKDDNKLIKPAYIGDTEGDELSARDAGYAFILANYGFGQSKNPDRIINSLKELMTINERVK